METLFAEYNQELQLSLNIKENLKVHTREWESTNRKMTGLVQQVHTRFQEGESICEKVKEIYPQITGYVQEIEEIIGMESYYRYNFCWRNQIQRTIFVMAYVHWLETRELLNHQEIQKIIGGSENGLQVEVEDYLTGVSYITGELSRLCVNAVIAKNYSLPGEISTFAKELHKYVANNSDS
eukprot:TRINITY_DN1647_c0_g2_i2.p1 TRINITY_DN1647_c0_g2~~TRINITY_DN1647_c0_g2_i2.p1  ORF type:complete len:181 (-),score=36.03 TRINITY_DN1647_c0_g2_i2:117-659(-)